MAITQKAQIEKELETYKQALKMEVEKYRAKSEQFNFVTKLQFETEFKTYQLLFQYIYHADIYTSCLYPRLDIVSADKETEKEERLERFKAQRAVIKPFYEAIEQNAPFIPTEIYEKFLNIQDLMASVTVAAQDMHDLGKVHPGDYKEINKYNDKLKQAVKDIIIDVRSYLSTLKVQD